MPFRFEKEVRVVFYVRIVCGLVREEVEGCFSGGKECVAVFSGRRVSNARVLRIRMNKSSV